MNRPHIKKFHIAGLNNQAAENRLIEALKNEPGDQGFEIDQKTSCLTLHSAQPIDEQKFIVLLAGKGFAAKITDAADNSQNPQTENSQLSLRIAGMTCHSCEVLIERSWKKMDGVKEVTVSSGSGKAILKTDGRKITLHDLQSAVGDSKYKIRWDSNPLPESEIAAGEKLSFGRITLLFILVIVIAKIFGSLGISTNLSVSAGLGIGAALVIGLIASASSCLAINGGLLLSTAASFNEKYGSPTGLGRMRPVFMFLGGRVASYAALGGALGLIGKSLTPSPLITALITIAAAIYMLAMGLEMLKIAPAWLKKIMPGMPKSLSHKILDAQEKKHPLTPAFIGAATFFLPCGFTQSLQLYALTTGSPVKSALILMAFALGTVPALLALGFAGNSLKGSLGRFFFQFSGALVVVMGLFNINNALAIAGYPLNWPTFASATVAQGDNTNATAAVPVAVDEKGVQVVKMGFKDYSYFPDHFTVKKNLPVRWEIDGDQVQGCAKSLVSRQLNIQKVIQPGINVIEFTPKEAGEIQFSCSMGMYRGSFSVVE